MPSIIRVSALLLVALLATTLPRPALATGNAPKVVATVNPLYALVLAVMDGVPESNAPRLLVAANRSPHDFQLKPSDGRKLAGADVVFWFGPELETALAGPIAALTDKATLVNMLQQPELVRLEADGALDPHVWLNPKNAFLMVDAIARTLSARDPENAALYNKNAKRAQNRIRLLTKRTGAFLAGVKTEPFLVHHDGLGYLVAAFGLNQVGFIASVAGREPGARHFSELLATVREQKVRCVFVEPQLPDRLSERLAAEGNVRLSALDVLGAGLEPSPTLYMRLMQQIARQLVACLSPKPAG